MKSFIQETIDKLYDIYGDNISEVKVLLPSSRARLFFNKELTLKLSEKPIWQPDFFSIDSLTKKITSLSTTTPFRLIVELYKVYSRYHTESFDKFYYWGDMLVKDFDTIDNYMVDAKKLFININDLKEIENQFDFLSDEQADMVLKFWNVFTCDKEHSKHKKSFLTIWNTLLPIYDQYKTELRKNGIGYKGMIYREATEKLNSDFNAPLFEENSVFAFIGFNALSKSEKRIFNHIKERYITHFFWDYDNYYLSDKREEAGLFVRSNIAEFGDEFETTKRDNFIKDKEITIINSPSISLECKYVWSFLEELYNKNGTLGAETAIVLTNEDMLLPVMYSIPENISRFNVTSGFNISQTSAYTFLEYLISLQTNKKLDDNLVVSFYYKDVVSIFNHPYFTMLLDDEQRKATLLINELVNSESLIYVPKTKLDSFPLLDNIFTHVSSSKQMSDYIVNIFTHITSNLPNDELRKERREFLTTIINATTITQNTIDNCEIKVSIAIFLSLLRKHISSQSISFLGEPLLGVQVMGILETRNIDFENVLIISVNEDNFPGTNIGKSFIPNSLRWGYQLPTPYHSEAMYSYYFYRLIQRAKNVHITYCSKSEGTTSGEPSRYIHQLKLESPFRSKIIDKSLSLSINIEKTELPIAQKTDIVYNKLSRYLSSERALSASALYKYITCPYSFYLRYIENLKEPETISETIESRDFGNVVHESLEKIYNTIINKSADIKSELSKIDDTTIKTVAEELISKITKTEIADFTGQISTLLNFVCRYIKNVIDYDSAHSEFSHYKHEVQIEEYVDIEIDNKPYKIKFKGFIDRIDILNSGTYRYIDYKTGEAHLTAPSIESLFDISNTSNSIAIMQILLYAYLTKQEVKPALYFTRAMNQPKYDPTIVINKQPIEHFSEVRNEYEIYLKAKLIELFDQSTSFRCTTESKTCQYCPYKNLCH